MSLPKLQAEAQKRKCSICGKEFEGYGHNADPVNAGRCCAECNRLYVVPLRIKLWKELH